MMDWRIVFVLGLFVLAVNGYFFVTAPNMLRYETDENVLVSVFDRSNTDITIWLECDYLKNGDLTTKQFSQKTVRVPDQEHPQLETIRVDEQDVFGPEIDEAIEKPGQLRLVASDGNTQKHVDIMLSYDSGYLIVHTDKPIYTPRQNVSVRVLALDESMSNALALDKRDTQPQVVFELVNPSGKIMSRAYGRPSKIRGKTPFYTSVFDIPANTELGTWTIVTNFIRQFETSERTMFEVEEYVLPTMNVTVTTNIPYILETTEHFQVTVEAKYLKDKKYSTTIIRGEQFADTMRAFSSKGKDLKQKGLGNKPQAADAVSDAEIRQLRESGQLGNTTPNSLINTLWMNNCLHFGMRAGGTEHRQLKWGDVTLSYDTELHKDYNERQTKTRTGVDITNIRDQKPRMYATGNEECPIKTYKKYADLRPTECLDKDSPFYLACVTNTQTPGPDQKWYINGPIGIHKLGKLMATMAKKAGLPEIHQGKRLTNTSVRKRLCQKLLSSNVPDTHAIHITGHKNADSLNNYRSLSNKQQLDISNILSESSSTHNVMSSYKNLPTSTNVHRTLTQSQTQSVTTTSQLPSSLFQNATISGGTFNITINTGSSNNPKRKRQEQLGLTDSDEELLLASQEH